MKYNDLFLLLPILFFLSCEGQKIDSRFSIANSTKSVVRTNQSPSLINIEGKLIKDRILVPKGYQRPTVEANTFAHYLENLALKEHESKVYYFNGTPKHSQNIHVAVLDIDTGKRDLQQCADAVMRLRAEYLYHEKRYEEIKFNFTNGFEASYAKWRNGKRIKVDGNKVTWYETRIPSSSYTEFRKYLNMVFSYAGTLSLDKELNPKPLHDINIGDVFIQGGSPGHAMLVVDLAIHEKTQEKIFLLAQSYMPAQDIHIVKNPNNSSENPWYSLSEVNAVIETPEWTFYPKDLKSF